MSGYLAPCGSSRRGCLESCGSFVDRSSTVSWGSRRVRRVTGTEPSNQKGALEMKRTSVFLTVAVALALPLAAFADADDHHVMASLVEIDGSGVQGMVNVVNVPGGTMIGVAAFGPTPGATYVSLYYSSRDCTLGGDSGIVSGETYDA